jgi:hypothetical protein
VARVIGVASQIAHAPVAVGLLSFPQSASAGIASAVIAVPDLVSVAVIIPAVPPLTVDVENTQTNVTCTSTRTYVTVDTTTTEVGLYE